MRRKKKWKYKDTASIKLPSIKGQTHRGKPGKVKKDDMMDGESTERLHEDDSWASSGKCA